jgi:hypothetical protein
MVKYNTPRQSNFYTAGIGFYTLFRPLLPSTASTVARHGVLARPPTGQKQGAGSHPGKWRISPTLLNVTLTAIQISAEQLLREAVDRQEPGLQAPTQRFADLEELHEFQGRKRREYEDYVRRNRLNMSNWTKYAQWELEQKECVSWHLDHVWGLFR